MKNPLIYCFFSILIIITALDILKSDKIFSELENRNLKSKIDFSFERYFDGDYTEKYEDYLNDQFILRDNWINLKSRSEFILGKIENNNIIYGKEGYLFEKIISTNKHREEVNVNAVNTLISDTDINVTVMIVPNSFEIYKENLPKLAPVINEKEELINIYNKIQGANKINLTNIMTENKYNYLAGTYVETADSTSINKSKYSDNIKENELYYKTDHHWTTDGAYLAYKEYIKSISKKPISLNEYKKHEISDFLGTYYSKAKPFNISADTLIYYDINGITMEIGDKEYNSIYDYSKLDTRDKYSLFLYGNNPLTILKNKNLSDNSKLIIFKDSYANSLVPFLTQNFQEIHVIDLRSFSPLVSKYLEDNNFDEILILYNMAGFISNADIVKLQL